MPSSPIPSVLNSVQQAVASPSPSPSPSASPGLWENPEFYKALAEIVKAAAWPVLVGLVIWGFRKEISTLLNNLRKLKIFDNEVEFGELVVELETKATAASTLINQAEPAAGNVGNLPENGPEDKFSSTDALLKSAGGDPRIAFEILSEEIARQVFLVAKTIGLPHRSVQGVIESLKLRGQIPNAIANTLESFLEVRNRLAHGQDAKDYEIIHVIKYGLNILKSVKAIPLDIHYVYKTNIPLYSTADADTRIHEVVGVMVYSITSTGERIPPKVFPTRNTNYQIEKPVSWDFSRVVIWPETWYRDPDTLEIKKAWDGSSEFTGVHIEL